MKRSLQLTVSALKHVLLSEFALGWASGGAGALHLVHGTIGSFEQGVDVFAVFGKSGGSDACREVECSAFKAERLVGFLGKALHDGEQDIALGNIAEDDAKFVAAEACHKVGSPWNAADAQRQFAQGSIAGAVAVTVVHSLEAVHVDHEDAQGVNLAPTG